MIYQSSLLYCMTILKNLVGHILTVDEPRQFLEKDPTSEQWKRIEDGIDRLASHPVWTADKTKSQKMRNINDALLKNQDARLAFGAVGLKTGLLSGADQVDPNCLD